MADTISPLQAIRERIGWSRTNMSRALGVSFEHLALAEQGAIIEPRKIYDGLAELGIDADLLKSQQLDWLAERAAALRTRLRERLKDMEG